MFSFTYELLDSEEEGRLLQKLDLEQRPASDNRIMHKDLYQSSFQVNMKFNLEPTKFNQ